MVVPTEKAYADVLLTCRDCGEQFTWTAGEQEFYHDQGLKNPPARCGPCRIARKEAQEANPRRPPAFGGNRPGGGGYRPAFGNGNGGNGEQRGAPMHVNAGAPGNGSGARGFGGGYASRPPKVLFDTVCAECGQATQVPFQPRGDRPVYCRTCFDRRRATGQY